MNKLEKYIESHSTPRSEVLDWIDRQTHLRTNYPRMLAGFEVGKLLETVSAMLRPMRVLELGTFTGYSSICLASSLPEGARLDAIEINDELQDLIHEGYRRAGVDDRVRLIIGDSKAILPTLDETYDLIYIDANKREYPEYLKLLLAGYEGGEGDSGNGSLDAGGCAPTASGSGPLDAGGCTITAGGGSLDAGGGSLDADGGLLDADGGDPTASGSGPRKPLVHSGTWIIADNVLWDGKVCEEHPKTDAQTQGIIAFNDAVAADPRLENYILPLRDGWNVIRIK